MSDRTVYQAMNDVMVAVDAIGKNRKADPKMGGYAFRGIDDLYNALHDKLADHGVFFVPEVLDTAESTYSTSGGATMRLVRVTVRYRFYGPAGDHVEAVTIGEAADTGDKAANKAMTAALKYLLFQVFCIATEDNEDADAVAPELGTRQAAQQAPAPKREPAPEHYTPQQALEHVAKSTPDVNAIRWVAHARWGTSNFQKLTAEQARELHQELLDNVDAVFAEARKVQEEAASE